MSTNDDLGRRLTRHFVAIAPVRAPDWLVPQALVTIESTRGRQSRLPTWLGPWTRVGAAVRMASVLLLIGTLILALLGAALFVPQAWTIRQPLIPPGLTAGPGEPIGSGLIGTWEREAEDGASYSLTIRDRGAPAVATVTSGPGSSFRRPYMDLGAASTVGDDRVTFGLTDACAVAEYVLSLSAAIGADGLTLTPSGDDCAERRSVLEGDWLRRSIDGPVRSGARYRIQLEAMTIDVTIPESFALGQDQPAAFAGTVRPRWSASFTSSGLAFLIMTESGSGSAAIDRCDPERGSRTTPTDLADYLAWSRASADLEVMGETELTVAGYPALRVDLAGGQGCAADYTPPPTSLMQGLHQREWAVDVGGRLVLLTISDVAAPWEPLTAEQLAVADAFVGSIEITPTR